MVVFLFLWLVTRAAGRATLGELSTFELLLYVTMGDLVQQAVTQQDYSVTAAFLAVGTFALLTVGLSWLQWRVPRTRPVVTGRPVLVFADGSPVEESMDEQRLSLADLLVAAREQGIRRTSEIEYAVLEADGRISFFTREGEGAGAPDKPPQG
nr:YetF domain-containing protein [Nocardioides soli]